MAAPRDDGQTWASRIRPDQEPAQEGPGKPSPEPPGHTPADGNDKDINQKKASANLNLPGQTPDTQEPDRSAGEKVHPNLDMSSYGQNTETPKETWAASVLRSDQAKGDAYLGLQQGGAQEEKGPSKWAQAAAALGAVGGAAAGTAIEKGFAGTGEFVSRFFGLPEHAAQSPGQQAAPEQDHNRDTGMDR